MPSALPLKTAQGVIDNLQDGKISLLPLQLTREWCPQGGLSSSAQGLFLKSSNFVFKRVVFPLDRQYLSFEEYLFLLKFKAPAEKSSNDTRIKMYQFC